MKKRLLLFFLMCCSIFAIAQQDTIFIKSNIADYNKPINYITDTLLFPSKTNRLVITGTGIIPETGGQLDLRSYGLNFKKLLFSECNEGSGYMDKGPWQRINSIVINDTSVLVDITFHAICGSSFLTDVRFSDKDSILQIEYYPYGSWASCDCCYGLTYCFQRIDHWGDAKLISTLIIKGVMIGENRSTFKE